jgi:hypothetical protein
MNCGFLATFSGMGSMKRFGRNALTCLANDSQSCAVLSHMNLCESAQFLDSEKARTPLCRVKELRSRRDEALSLLAGDCGQNSERLSSNERFSREITILLIRAADPQKERFL